MAGPRFSSQTINDLIFWGIHLCVVAIALGIVWVRLDATAKVMSKLVSLQNDELALVRKQTLQAEEQTRLVEQREAKRTEAVNLIMAQQKQLIDSTETSMKDIQERVNKISGDVTTTLEQIKLISKSVVGTAIEKEQEAVRAGNVAANARSKVVATSGALAQKKRQLSKANRVIAKEKKKNFVQRIFQPIGHD